jgi:hypothetical protein
MGVLEDIDKVYVDSTYSQKMKQLNSLGSLFDSLSRPTDLGKYLKYINQQKTLLSNIKSLDIKMDATALKGLMEKAFERAIEEWENKEVAVNTKYEDLLDKRITNLEDEAKEDNRRRIQEFDESNKIYLELENKRKRLETYSDDIIDICSEYRITTKDVDIDNSSFTIDELSSIYDKYLDFMSKKVSKTNFITLFRERVPNSYVQFGVVVLLFILAFTPVLDVVAVIFYGYLIWTQNIMKNKVKSLMVLYGLVFNIRPLEMGFKGEIDPSSLEAETVDEDSDERLNDISDEWSKELDELDARDPKKEQEEARAMLASRTGSIQKKYDSLVETFRGRQKELIESVSKEIDEATAEFEQRKKEVKLLGSDLSKSSVFDTKFRLGLRDEVIEEYVDVSLRNIVIRPNSDLEMHKKFLQVMFANAMCNVRINMLTAIICDPNRQGQELIDFYDSSLEQNIVFSNKNLDEILKDLKEFANANLKEMHGKPITEFNKHAEEVDMTPREYRLLVVLSQPKKVEEDEALMEFMSYSAQYGVFVWLVTSKDVPNTTVFTKPFEGAEHPYDIELGEFGSMVVEHLKAAKESSREKALTWKRFCEVAARDEDTWTKVSDDFVEIIPGFCEGDPNRALAYAIGNQGNVHIIGVGTTGAGKSVFLNFVIGELTKRYSPRDLELWMIDFKGNEFVKYLPKEGHPAMLPHMKACLCTSDGDYAGSVFTALRKETERRFEFFRERNFKNVKQWNERCRSTGDMNSIIPRILCVNDEFQVIFQKAEDKVVQQINDDITYITKLGRAAGVHLFFTSQSMKGTIKDDVLQQFSLRFVLRCDEEVSTQVLGSKLAAEIKQPNGYLYVKSYEDKDPTKCKRFKTPYICDEGPTQKHPDNFDELQDHIDKMAALAVEQNIPVKSVITYEEATKHDISEIDAFYEANRDKIPEGFFLLGMRMTYSENKAPDNIVLTAANNTHIFSAFENIVDLVNFYKSIKRNIDLSGKGSIVINSQVKDLSYLCEIDKDYVSPVLELSSEKIDVYTFYGSVIKPTYEGRAKTGNKIDPVYIILIGWDKARGFGVDKDAGFCAELATTLQLCGEYNIHFIFIGSGVGAVGANVIEACKYRIAGKVSESDSYKVVDSKVAFKTSELKDGYMYIYRSGDVKRAKIYQSKIERTIESNELVL